MDVFTRDGSGYLAIQNTRPQTIGHGLVDSPLLRLAWIAETFEAWADLPVDRDQLLTNVSLYWFTGSGATVRQVDPAPAGARWTAFKHGGHVTGDGSAR